MIEKEKSLNERSNALDFVKSPWAFRQLREMVLDAVKCNSLYICAMIVAFCGTTFNEVVTFTGSWEHDSSYSEYEIEYDQ